MRQSKSRGMGKANFTHKTVLTGALLLGCTPPLHCPKAEAPEKVTISEYGYCIDANKKDITVKKTTSILTAKVGATFGREIQVPLPFLEGAKIHEIAPEKYEVFTLSNFKMDSRDYDLLFEGQEKPKSHNGKKVPVMVEMHFGAASKYGEPCNFSSVVFERKSDTEIKIKIERVIPTK